MPSITTTQLLCLGAHRRWGATEVVIALGLVGCSAGSTADPVAAVQEPIIGGSTAPAAAWPWSVRILHAGSIATGSLIAPDWVLTTAHSVQDPLGSYTVELRDGQTVGIVEAIPHPSYVDDGALTGHFDMGLLRLASPVSAGNGLDFIRPAVDGDAPGTNAVAIGWGMTNNWPNNPQLPSQLQQVALPVVPNTNCSAVLPHRNFLHPDEMCAGFADGHAGVCFGDSGGPLMVERRPGHWEQIGVPTVVKVQETLFGPFVCNSYAIFGRTTVMQGWVRQHVPDPAWFPVLNNAYL